MLGGGGTSWVGSFRGAAARGEARSVAGRQGDDAGSLFADAGSFSAAFTLAALSGSVFDTSSQVAFTAAAIAAAEQCIGSVVDLCGSRRT